MNRIAVVAIVEYEGKVLVVARKNNHNMFGLPGGKVEPGESLLEAVKRELLEETGITALAARHVYVINDDNGYVVHAYIITAWHGTPQSKEGPRVWFEYWRHLHRKSKSPWHEYNLEAFCAIQEFRRRNLAKSIMRTAIDLDDVARFDVARFGTEVGGFAGFNPAKDSFSAGCGATSPQAVRNDAGVYYNTQDSLLVGSRITYDKCRYAVYIISDRYALATNYDDVDDEVRALHLQFFDGAGWFLSARYPQVPNNRSTKGA